MSHRSQASEILISNITFISAGHIRICQQDELHYAELPTSAAQHAYNKGIYAIGATEYGPSAFVILLNCSNLSVPNKKPACRQAGYGQASGRNSIPPTA